MRWRPIYEDEDEKIVTIALGLTCALGACAYDDADNTRVNQSVVYPDEEKNSDHISSVKNDQEVPEQIQESNTEQELEENTDEFLKEEFKKYFLGNYSAKDEVCLLDVTLDGQLDMIVIHQEDLQQYWKCPCFRTYGF